MLRSCTWPHPHKRKNLVNWNWFLHSQYKARSREVRSVICFDQIKSFHSIVLVETLWLNKVIGSSGASETLSGVTQLKIGGVCLYIYVWTYDVILYFDLHVFFVLALLSTLSQISLNRFFSFIDHYPYNPRNWIVYRFEFFYGCS